MDLRPTDVLRMRQLLKKYADLPMDFADATLLGKQSGKKFDELPFPNFPSAYKWTAPK